MNVLECEGLVKAFDDLVAVDDVGFHIAAGETYGLLGPNGAGKTTCISMIAGILAADAGKVTVGGHVVSTRSTEGKAEIGYVPQDIAIYPDLTARENLRFFGKLYGIGKERLAIRTDEVLEVIGLKDRGDDRTDEYSGGMKRRLNIGIGLLHEPSLLILDEPTVGVDPQSRNAILESVELLGQTGTAVLYTTHYMEEAERLCDRVAIIDGGKIRAEGTRRELVELVGQRDTVNLGVVGSAHRLVDGLAVVGQIDKITATEGSVEILVDGASRVLPRILDVAQQAGVAVSGVEVVEPNLESVFLHLTGKALRD
ncbi:MAG: ABC transporter ATP-binding protein [Acidimicrobiia bacterium]|nr:ABC transporter ATP-binding protein [Acidimicrobiia bacterium]MDX2467779.1 ABC transporter ATP-binding protein [Acidimicrobiia bacterium]